MATKKTPGGFPPGVLLVPEFKDEEDRHCDLSNIHDEYNLHGF
ncbi:MAG: hypothetical protein ACLP0B_28440 [Steroidobacteraceae bacterium]